MRMISIRLYVLALSAFIAVPMLLFLVLLFIQLQINERRSLESRVSRQAAAIAAAAEPVLLDMLSSVRLLATSPDLEDGSLAAFHARAKRGLADSGAYLIALDVIGKQLLNTRIPFGIPAGVTSDMASFDEAIKSNKPVVSGVFFGKTGGKWVFNIVQPLPDNPETNARALIITRNAEDLADGLQEQDLPPSWQSAIFDKSGKLLASHNPDILVPGTTAAELKGIRFGTTQKFEYGNFGSPDALAGHAEISPSGWQAVVWGSASAAQSPILKNWRTVVFGGVALLSLSILLGYFATERLRRAVTSIARMAVEVGKGNLVRPPSFHIREFDVIAKALSTASSQRNEAESSIRFAMRELAHRTKNLMTVVLSMIRQGARSSTSVEEMRGTLEDRIYSLSRSIDLLTSKEKTGVSLRELAEQQLSGFTSGGKSISISGEDVLLKPDAVQYLGMAFHELATNAMKHGALSRHGGKVFVTWLIVPAEDGSKNIHLIWKEIGGPPATPPTRNGFGTKVIKNHMAAVTMGKVTLSYKDRGFSWSLQAPLAAFTEITEDQETGSLDHLGDGVDLNLDQSLSNKSHA